MSFKSLERTRSAAASGFAGSAVVARRSAPDPLDVKGGTWVFQLVLQFARSSPQDFDGLVALEDELLELESLADAVDGHDIGGSEMNLFLVTATPQPTFSACLPLVEASGLGFRGAGFRPKDGESFERIWPLGSRDPFNVT